MAPCANCGGGFVPHRRRKRYCSLYCVRQRKSYTDTAESIRERFFANVAKGDGCWEWTGSMHLDDATKGYGTFFVRGHTAKAHRVSWELHFGAIPKGEGHHGICVLHKCDNRKCVRPDHLFLGTHKDNMEDMARKGRGVSASRPNEAHPMVKLTNAAVAAIREAAAGGTSQSVLAKQHGVRQSHISRIVNHVRRPPVDGK